MSHSVNLGLPGIHANVTVGIVTRDGTSPCIGRKVK